MPFRRLILTTIAALCLLLPTSVSAATTCQYQKETVNRTDNRPQLKDIGMHDVLAVTNGSTVAPPTTVRVIHDSPTGMGATTQSAAVRSHGILRQPRRNLTWSVIGYIYMIRCLRL